MLSHWSEPTVSGALRPTLGTAIAAYGDISQAHPYVRLDITSQVKSWIASPFQALGPALRASSATPTTTFLGSRFLYYFENSSNSLAASPSNGAWRSPGPCNETGRI